MVGKLLKRIAEIIDHDILELSFDFNRHEILLTITEAEIPILIHKIEIYNGCDKENTWTIAAELYSELLTENLTSYDIRVLDKVVSLIEKNEQVFNELLCY